jgi:hypothetical protein
VISSLLLVHRRRERTGPALTSRGVSLDERCVSLVSQPVAAGSAQDGVDDRGAAGAEEEDAGQTGGMESVARVAL